MPKRIVVCCDGTWQNGLNQPRTAYTNVLRLARAVEQEDQRANPPIAQVVFYQTGVGSEENLFSHYVEGTTGGSLGDKVEQAYAFIAHNFQKGDEIFLFGFSRGAYTARMVAQFILEIGVLDRTDMDSFSKIFNDYQLFGTAKDPLVKGNLEKELAHWRSPEASGKKRAATGDFMVKFLGVWDTVGSVGMPEEIRTTEAHKMYGFHDSRLGEHIERACQALALQETRLDFMCNKFEQTDLGRAKNQYVKQVWFTGCHSDVGGGYNDHDLADLTLTWMTSELEPYLALDFDYLHNIIEPVAPWGQQRPHNPVNGVFLMALEASRLSRLPSVPDDSVTHEYFHASVLGHSLCPPRVRSLAEHKPEFVCPLGKKEIEMKEKWIYNEDSPQVKDYRARLEAQSRLSRMTIFADSFAASKSRMFSRVRFFLTYFKPKYFVPIAIAVAVVAGESHYSRLCTC